MRLIDADALCLGKFVEPRTEWHLGWNDALEAASTQAPTIDAVPVKRGRWISLTECANAGVYCSVCNKKVYKEDYAWCNKRNKMRSNYCPNCGAKMDEADDNDIN